MPDTLIKRTIFWEGEDSPNDPVGRTLSAESEITYQGKPLIRSYVEKARFYKKHGEETFVFSDAKELDAHIQTKEKQKREKVIRERANNSEIKKKIKEKKQEREARIKEAKEKADKDNEKLETIFEKIVTKIEFTNEEKEVFRTHLFHNHGNNGNHYGQDKDKDNKGVPFGNNDNVDGTPAKTP